ncbi:MAG: hypothetical protein LQ342_000065, partial [Letrouitia transgressa]
NGTAPYLVGYLNTFDNHVCQAAFAKCRVDNPGSQSCPKCGTLKATDVQPSTASTSAAASSTAAGTSGGTAAAPAATSSPTNAAMMIGAELGIKGAVGLLAAMGLML